MERLALDYPFAALLLDAAAKGTVLLLVAGLAVWLARRSSAAVGHAIWRTTMAGLIVLPVASWALPTWRIPILPTTSVVDSGWDDVIPDSAVDPLRFAPRRAVDTVPVTDNGQFSEPPSSAPFGPVAFDAPADLPRPDSGVKGAQPATSPQSESLNATGTNLAQLHEPMTTTEPAAVVPVTPPLSTVELIVRLVVVVWSLGAALFGAVLFVGLWRTTGWRRSSLVVSEGVWPRLLVECRDRLGLTRSVELREHADSVVPLTYGILRPVVLLPRIARDWDESMQRAVLMHELAHVQRHDVAYQLLGRATCMLYWFHPLAWFALYRLRQEREQACDDAVVHAGERASDYASQLLRVARLCGGLRGPSLGVAMAEGSNLERRVVSLFDGTRSHAPQSRRTTVLSMLVGMTILAGLAPIVPTASRAEPFVADEPDAPDEIDRAGEAVAEPLPPGAVVRLGTAAYRHGSRISSMGVSADGTLAVTASGSGPYSLELAGRFSPARVFDLADGRCLYTLPAEHGPYTEAVGLSPDGTTLVTKDDEYLDFRDAKSGRELRKLDYSKGGGSRSVTDWTTFTPDGKHVAINLKGHAIQLVDVATAKIVRTFEMRAAASACVFSADGKVMATGGFERIDGGWFARTWDVETGRELREFPAGSFKAANGVKRALALSPDGKLLAGGGYGDRRVRLWETETGNEPRTFPELGEEITSLAYAPDGRTIAAAAERIHLYDPVTGEERFRIDERAFGLQYSRDGKVLIGAVDGAIHRWDAATGRQLRPPRAQDSAVEQIVVSADGRTVFTTDLPGNLLRWDASGGQAPRRIAEGVDRGFVASPDRRFLAWADDGDTHLYDTVADRFVNRFPIGGNGATVVAFLPDGKTLLTLGGGYGPATTHLWDVASGKEQRSFPVATKSDAQPVGGGRGELPDVPSRLWDVTTGRAGLELDAPENVPEVPNEAGFGTTDLGGKLYVPHYTTRRASLSPDGKTLAIGPDYGAVFDNSRMKSLDGRAFSPDGRLFVDWAKNPWGSSRMDHVHVWDATTGRAVASVSAGPHIGTANAAFSPDGRTLATAAMDGTVRLWEVATWNVRAEFHGHRDRITAVAFGPDGRLFTGGLDTAILGWDVRPPRVAADETLAAAWAGLAKSDARTGFRAQGRFLGEPGKTVEWFAARVPAVTVPDPARVEALVAQLDDPRFATREKATAELGELGPLVADALRETVATTSSAEARRRATGLLEAVENGVIRASELRALRAVEVLEWIDTREARAHLLALSQGVPSARLTRGASAAHERGRNGPPEADAEETNAEEAVPEFLERSAATPPAGEPDAMPKPDPIVPLDKVVWWGGTVDGFEPGIWLTPTDVPGYPMVPMDSLVKYRILVRNSTDEEIECLVRLLPFEGQDCPYLIPSGELNVKGTIEGSQPAAKYRSRGAVNPLSGIDAAYIVTLAAGESVLVPGEYGLYVGKTDDERYPRIDDFVPGTHWIVQPLLVHALADKERAELNRLLGEFKVQKIDRNGKTSKEPAVRVAAPDSSQGTVAYAKYHLEVGTLDAAAHRHAEQAIWGEVEKGIQCGIRLLNPKREYAVGDTLEAELLWRNTGEAVISTTRPRQLDLYPVIEDGDGNEPGIDFGARFDLLPGGHDFQPGEVRSLGIVRVTLVADGTRKPKDNTEPGHAALPPGKYKLSGSGGVGNINPRSGKYEFTVVAPETNAP